MSHPINLFNHKINKYLQQLSCVDRDTTAQEASGLASHAVGHYKYTLPSSHFVKLCCFVFL